MFALVFKGVVIQIEEQPFPVHSALSWIPINDEVKIDYTYDNGIFSPPEPTSPRIIPDTVFQKAAKIMIKSMMGFINGTVSKAALNDIFDNVKDHLKEITSD